MFKLLINLIISVAFTIKHTHNCKSKFFFYFFAVGFIVTFAILKSTVHLPNTYDKLKALPKKYFFTTESIKITNEINSIKNQAILTITAITKMKYKNHSSFFKFVILLSGDVNLNPGPQNNSQQENKWENFRKRGLHFIHLNVNSILPKIEELRSIAQNTKAAVIGISESKLDKTVFDSEVAIEGYDLLRKDRNRHGGGVACYVRNDICYNPKKILQDDLENIFIDILLPKTKPITVGIVYKPPNQTGFIEKLNLICNDFDSANAEVHILSDMNINVLQNGKYIKF